MSITESAFTRLVKDVYRIKDKITVTAIGEDFPDFHLEEKEKELINQHYGERLGITDISKLWGISTTKFNKIKDKTLRKLRHPARKKIIESHIKHVVYKKDFWEIGDLEKHLDKQKMIELDLLRSIGKVSKKEITDYLTSKGGE